MSIEDVIRKGPEPVNDLLRKLADTTDGAVKTRQKLLAQLREEIELLIRRKEEHLFPALERHRETKKLVDAARKGSEKVNELLSELEGMEVTDEDFSRTVAELRRAFQAETQSERKDAIPAIKKALGAEEAQEIADRMLSVAEEGGEEMQRAAEETAGAAAQARESSAAIGKAAVETAETLTHSTSRTAASATQGAAEGADAVFAVARNFMPEIARDFAEPPIHAMRDVALAWLEFVEAASSSSARLASEMSGATTPAKWATISTRAGTELASAWLSTSSKIMAASTRLSVGLADETRRERR